MFCAVRWLCYGARRTGGGRGRWGAVRSTCPLAASFPEREVESDCLLLLVLGLQGSGGMCVHARLFACLLPYFLPGQSMGVEIGITICLWPQLCQILALSFGGNSFNFAEPQFHQLQYGRAASVAHKNDGAKKCSVKTVHFYKYQLFRCVPKSVCFSASRV